MLHKKQQQLPHDDFYAQRKSDKNLEGLKWYQVGWYSKLYNNINLLYKPM